jgi:hypothetical protein
MLEHHDLEIPSGLVPPIWNQQPEQHTKHQVQKRYKHWFLLRSADRRRLQDLMPRGIE